MMEIIWIEMMNRVLMRWPTFDEDDEVADTNVSSNGDLKRFSVRLRWVTVVGIRERVEAEERIEQK